VFQVQAEVAGRVAQELGVALADSARRELAERPTRSLDAYDLYLRAEAAALGHGRTDPPSLRLAIPLYERALQLDPTFALAWGRLATARSYLYNNAVPSRELGLAARTAVEQALALAPRQPASVLGQAFYHRLVERDLPAAHRTLSEFLPLAPRDPQILSALAGIEREQGRAEAALERFRQAARLDPRSPAILNTMGQCLLVLRRFDEADSVFAESLELAPGGLITITGRARARLGLGDLTGARTIAAAAAAETDSQAVAVHFSTYYELHWLLDSALQALAVAAGPEAYDGDVGTWALVHAHIYAAWGDRRQSRAYADSARAGFSAQLDDAPDDAQTHVLLGLSLAFLGRDAEAVRHGERAATLLPVSGGGDIGLYIAEVLARIYARAGMPEKAVEQLGVLLRSPSPISREWLRIDPNYAPIRNHPAFVRLVGGTA
jgi:tetratricopeptide (TPR) repeat protein